MKIIQFLERIITSPARSRKKAMVLKSVLKNEQKNEGVINLHRIDPKNAGDFYSAPHLYFDELRNTQLDIFDYKNPNNKITDRWIEKVSNNSLIIGGGGLLNRSSFFKQMHLFETLAKNGKKSVLWGVGHNSKNHREFGKIFSYNIDVKSFGLAGTRDYNAPGDWVPCVSCMNEVFDKPYEASQEIGVVFHKKTLKQKSITSKFRNFPTTSNTTDLESLVNFIGKSDTVITDSYHAMYWSMLLEKKVVVIPNSSKFFDFKYSPVLSDFNSCLKDAKKANRYTGLLSECRSINQDFAKKVFNYLEL